MDTNPALRLIREPAVAGATRGGGVSAEFQNDWQGRSSPAPALPAEYAHLTEEPELAAVWEAEVTARVAEARKITELLDYRDRKVAEATQSRERVDNFTGRAAAKAAHHQAGVLLGVPERHIASMLGTAATARQWLPQLWDQFCRGEIDLSRLKVLVSGAADLIETNSGRPEDQQELTAALDAQFAAVAPSQNERVLKEQIHHHVAAADPSGDQRRYERARSSRGVSLTHHSNGMSTLRAVLPTLTATRIYQEVDAAAAGMPRRQAHPETGEPEDTTRYNRTADVLTAWIDRGAAGGNAEGAEESGTAVGSPSRRPTAAAINITVPLETLTGDSQAPAVSSDGAFTLPASEARRIANDPTADNTYYLTGTTTGTDGVENREKIVKIGKTNPLDGLCATGELAREALIQHLNAKPNLLDAKSSARFVTGNLRTAVQIRAGQCQAHGCTEPATRSEVDHIISHETGGATDAQNSQVLCHHHHEIKSHGYLPGNDPPLRASPDPPPDWATTGADPPRANPGGAP